MPSSEYNSPARIPAKKVNLWGVVWVTYGLVIITTIVAVGGYYWLRSQQPGTEQNEADQTRRIMIGNVWVAIYPGASYAEAASHTEGSEMRGQIVQGSVHFSSKDGAGAVMSFYQDNLKQNGFLTTMTGNAGGTVQGVKRSGKTSALITVEGTAEGSRGDIRTIDHIDPKLQ